MLCFGHVVIARLQQLGNDVFNVLANVTGFGERGGVCHDERHVQHTGHGLREQGFARAGGTDQQNVALGQFDVILFAGLLVAQPLVVVVNRHRKRTFGHFLPDDVVVQVALEFCGRGERIVSFAVHRFQVGQFVANDVIAQVNAFVANEHGGTGDQLLDFMLAFAAKRAIQCFFGGRAFFVGHQFVLSNA